MISDKQYQIIIEVLKPYDPERLGIFGSYARNEEKPGSDMDILVSFSKTYNLLQLVGIEQDLSEKLGIKVDLITENSVNPRLKKYIDQDIIMFLE